MATKLTKVYDDDNLMVVAENLGGSGGGLSTQIDLYIDPTGDDSTGDGTSSAPWATLGKALSEAQHANADKVIIHVADGTYNNTEETYSSVEFRPRYIEIAGNDTNPENVVFTNSTGNYKFIAHEILGLIYMHWHGVTFDNGRGIRVGTAVLKLENVKFTNITTTGIRVDKFGYLSLTGTCEIQCDSSSSYPLGIIIEDNSVAYFNTDPNISGAYIGLTIRYASGVESYSDITITTNKTWGTGISVQRASYIGTNNTVNLTGNGSGDIGIVVGANSYSNIRNANINTYETAIYAEGYGKVSGYGTYNFTNKVELSSGGVIDITLPSGVEVVKYEDYWHDLYGYDYENALDKPYIRRKQALKLSLLGD